MTERWLKREVTLWFRIGERKAFAVRRPGLVFAPHFLELPPDPDESALPFDLLGRDAGVILLPSHPVSATLPSVTRTGRFIRYAPSQYRRHYIDLTGTYADYLGSFSGKTRSTLTRKLRKFEELSGGQIPWREYRTPEELEEFHNAARDLSAKTYQERLLGSGLPDSDDFRREMSDLATRDRVRAYLLFHEGRPVSYLYCPAEGAALLYAYLGYDPAFARWSPGTVLQLLVLERLFEQATFRVFDFTQGQGAHKELFGTAATLCADLYYFSPSLGNRAAVSSHRLTATFQREVVNGLDRLGVKSRLKKFLRKA